MSSQLFITITVLTSSAVCISNAVVTQTNEVKQIYAQHLCGATFIEAWQTICNSVFRRSKSRRRSKRSIEGKKKIV